MTDKTARQFLDTNIIVYAYDNSGPEKQKIAGELLLDLWEHKNGCISMQVLQEFYVTIAKKVPATLLVSEAVQLIDDLGKWKLHVPLVSDVIESINIQQRNKLSFWDAMIVNSAKSMQCKTIWTEDLNDGQVVEGVTVKNPFRQVTGSR